MKNLAAKLILTSILAAFNVSAYAGLPVIDIANVTQSTVTALENVQQTAKQLEQYRTQLQQYEDQIRNTTAPAKYLWDKANQTISKILITVDTLNAYKRQAGNLDAYLAKYKTVNGYQTSNCFTSTGCSASEMRVIQDTRTEASEAQKRANDALVHGLDQQQKLIQDDADNLAQLQSNAQSAQGRMEAMGYANQLASAQTNQLLQIRSIMLQQQAAIAARNQAIADREAQEEASGRQLRQGTYQPSSARTW